MRKQASGGNLIFDGGFATQLTIDGYKIDGDPLWSARVLSTNPDAIVKVHKRFLEAGADAIISSSYQASLSGFQKHLKCTEDEAVQYIKLSAKLINRAITEFWDEYKSCHLHQPTIEGPKNQRFKPICCASLGPYGACLSDCSEYTGSYVDTVSEEELARWHDERLNILAKEAFDLYIFETIPALAEAKAAVKLMKKYPQIQFAVSFSCKDGTSLCHGESFREAVEFLNTVEQVVAVGINCTSPYVISSLLKSIKGCTAKKILIKPNSGAEWTEEKIWSSAKQVNISDYVKEWRNLGANWIGGCCTIGPKDITEIKQKLTDS